MDKYEIRRFTKLLKLAEQLQKVSRAALQIAIDDEKTLDKAKNKATDIIEDMHEVATILAEELC